MESLILSPQNYIVSPSPIPTLDLGLGAWTGLGTRDWKRLGLHKNCRADIAWFQTLHICPPHRLCLPWALVTQYEVWGVAESPVQCCRPTWPLCLPWPWGTSPGTTGISRASDWSIERPLIGRSWSPLSDDALQDQGASGHHHQEETVQAVKTK